MNISSAGQIFSLEHVSSRKDVSSQAATQVPDAITDIIPPPRNVDLRNVSINEINELIRSGVEGLLEVVPFISPQIVNQYGAERAANIKIDFLGQIERSIGYKKSIGQETEFLQELLETLKEIDGTKFPSQIDVSV